VTNSPKLQKDLAMPNKNIEYRQVLEKMSSQANDNCGLVYELFAKRFSSMVDAYAAQLLPEGKAAFVELASGEFDYHTPEQRAEQRKSSDEMGLCCHGLDEQTCPCGCFEY
jgi:hypothetical protein